MSPAPAATQAVAAAYDGLVERAAAAGVPLEGVLVSPMRTGGLELLVGVVSDPDWGKVRTQQAPRFASFRAYGRFLAKIAVVDTRRRWAIHFAVWRVFRNALRMGG